jgi:hypothetical protein
MNSTLSTQQIPDWLRITKVAEGHYRVTDTSVEAVGLYLGSFPTQQAAKRFAIKVSEARAETRARNLRQMRDRAGAGTSMGL